MPKEGLILGIQLSSWTQDWRAAAERFVVDQEVPTSRHILEVPGSWSADGVPRGQSCDLAPIVARVAVVVPGSSRPVAVFPIGPTPLFCFELGRRMREHDMRVFQKRNLAGRGRMNFFEAVDLNRWPSAGWWWRRWLSTERSC